MGFCPLSSAERHGCGGCATGEGAVGLLGRWGDGCESEARIANGKGPEEILAFPESRVPSGRGGADQKVVLKFGVGKDEMRQNSSRGNDGHHQISGIHAPLRPRQGSGRPRSRAHCRPPPAAAASLQTVHGAMNGIYLQPSPQQLSLIHHTYLPQ